MWILSNLSLDVLTAAQYQIRKIINIHSFDQNVLTKLAFYSLVHRLSICDQNLAYYIINNFYEP